MRKLLPILLLGYCLSADAGGQCASNGFDVCERSKEFVSWLNAKSRTDDGGKYFRVSKATSTDGNITVHYALKTGKNGLDMLLTQTNSTVKQFARSLSRVSQQSACSQPVQRIIEHGGSYRAVYELPDGEVFAENLIVSCRIHGKGGN